LVTPARLASSRCDMPASSRTILRRAPTASAEAWLSALATLNALATDLAFVVDLLLVAVFFGPGPLANLVAPQSSKGRAALTNTRPAGPELLSGIHLRD